MGRNENKLVIKVDNDKLQVPDVPSYCLLVM